MSGLVLRHIFTTGQYTAFQSYSNLSNVSMPFGGVILCGLFLCLTHIIFCYRLRFYWTADNGSGQQFWGIELRTWRFCFVYGWMRNSLEVFINWFIFMMMDFYMQLLRIWFKSWTCASKLKWHSVIHFPGLFIHFHSCFSVHIVSLLPCG